VPADDSHFQNYHCGYTRDQKEQKTLYRGNFLSNVCSVLMITRNCYYWKARGLSDTMVSDQHCRARQVYPSKIIRIFAQNLGLYNYNHTLLRFLPPPYAFVLSAFTAINIRTRSPTFVMPSSLRTEWSHSSNVSPVMLFPV
jgi:hypothetical protein